MSGNSVACFVLSVVYVNHNLCQANNKQNTECCTAHIATRAAHTSESRVYFLYVPTSVQIRRRVLCTKVLSPTLGGESAVKKKERGRKKRESG